jgi:signal transduction protein with GAF and PtsI domain
MSAVSVPPVKKLIRSIRLSEAKVLAGEILGQPTIDGAKQILRRRLKNYMAKHKMRKTGAMRAQ